MSNEIIYDKIGQEMKVGSIIAMPDSRSVLKIGRIQCISPKTILAIDINSESSYNRGSRKRHQEVICLDEMETTVIYLMTRNL